MGFLLEEADTNHYQFIDLFAGCGGLSLGLMKAGWQGLFAIERDTFAFQTLSHNFGGDNALSPLRHKWPEWLPETPHEIGEFIHTYRKQLRELRGKVDLIAGGPPCQGFSMAGRRQKDDPRNQLFRLYIETVKLIRPRFLVLENVQGISVGFSDDANHAEPSDPASNIRFSDLIKASLGRLKPGYQVFPGIVRASDFGVPQWRPRYIMFGVRNDVWKSVIRHHPKEECDPHIILHNLRQSFLAEKGLTVPVGCGDAIDDFVNLATRDSTETQGFKELVYQVPEKLTAYMRLMRENMGDEAPNSLRLANHRANTIKRWTAILADRSIRRGVKLTSKDRAKFEIEGKHSFAVLSRDQPSHTLTTLPDDLLHYSRPRILTVRECARLQSFPDWFAFCGKYTTGGDRRTKEAPRYTQVGNAVAPLVAEAIGLALLKLDQMAQGPS